MVKTQGSDAGNHWLGHDVCTVVPTSDTNFKNSSVNLAGRLANPCRRDVMSTDIQRQERVIRDKRHHAKVPWSKWGCFHSLESW